MRLTFSCLEDRLPKVVESSVQRLRDEERRKISSDNALGALQLVLNLPRRKLYDTRKLQTAAKSKSLRRQGCAQGCEGLTKSWHSQGSESFGL